MTYIDTTKRHIESQGDLLDLLNGIEEDLLRRHPQLRSEARRRVTETLVASHSAETRAIALLEWVRRLRRRIEDGDLAPWEAAASGMAMQERLMLYRLPEFRSWMAKKEGKGGGRPSQDPDADLAVRVLRHLRSRGLTWEASLAALADAADDLQEIAGVEVDRASRRGLWKFRRGDAEQEFSETTLRRKKFPAARPR